MLELAKEAKKNQGVDLEDAQTIMECKAESKHYDHA